MSLEFVQIFSTNFVGSLGLKGSREVFAIKVRSPQICVNIAIGLGINHENRF